MAESFASQRLWVWQRWLNLQAWSITVVHELIHLEMVPVLSELGRSEANRLEEEHAVNHIAEALLKLDRE